MADKNQYAGVWPKDAGVIQDNKLPSSVREEVLDTCTGCYCAIPINPIYYPKLAAWLTAESMPIETYIVWWSW